MVQVTMDRYLSNTTLFFNLDEFTSLQRLREVPFELLEPNGLRSEVLKLIYFRMKVKCAISVDRWLM